MPPDYVDHPPHSSDSSPAFQNTSIPNSDMSGRIPLVQVRKDEDNRKGETSQASKLVSFLPFLSVIVSLALLLISSF